MTSGHLEVETKYDVDEAFAVPDLSGLAGVATVDAPVEHQLEAVYFDTEDLRLLRARVTLRRRTGGADAGWHLKLPGRDGPARTARPAGAGDHEAAAGPAGAGGGRPRGAHAAQPVATLRTRRVVTALRAADGELLAEIADDTVTRHVPPPAPGAAGRAAGLARGRGGARRGRRRPGRGGRASG